MSGKVIDVAVATPIAGVTNVGLVANTNLPVPVSSLITLNNCALVVAANALRLLAVVVNVPLVGNVKLVLAVVAKVKL